MDPKGILKLITDNKVTAALVGAAVVAVALLAYFTLGGESPVSTGDAEATITILDTDRVAGAPDAPVTIVEYASMTCGHCAKFAVTTYPQLEAAYIKTGKIRYVFRDFPLDAVASAASALARCVPEDQYFSFIDLLFRNQERWAFVASPTEGLVEMGRFAGLSRERVEACIRDEKEFDRIRESVKMAQSKYNVNSTPTFVIGGTVYRGEMTIEKMREIIDPLLAAQ